MRASKVPGIAAALISLALAAAGCGGDDPADRPATRLTVLADLDPGKVTLARVSFCDLVPAQSVRKALAGASRTQEHWGNGDQPPMDGAESDLTHELGCSWRRSGHAARAWVFARPVTAAFGRQIVADARSRTSCTTSTSAAFGKPGLVQICDVGDERTRVRRAGLFGDVWLTCEVTGPGTKPAVTARTDTWCVAVTDALDTGR